jgi:hypothetical protein
MANIAAKLPNPGRLKPYQLVFLWAAHRKWTAEFEKAGEKAGEQL